MEQSSDSEEEKIKRDWGLKKMLPVTWPG